jgi:hypothetical protein
VSLVPLVVVVVVAAGSPRAHAQSVSVQAQTQFDQGQRLMQAGKLAEACAAFEASQKLEPVVTTLLNLADCREQNHQLATAWGAFVDANRMARATGNDKLARVATNHAHKLEARLSKLTIAVPADHQLAGLEVVRGGDRVDPAGWNHALPLDGGTYTITARAPSRSPWSITRTIKPESDAQTVEIPRLAEATPATTAAAGAGAGSPPDAPPAVASRPDAHAVVSPSVADTSPAPRTPPAEQAESERAGPRYIWPIALGVGALAAGGAALGFNIAGDHKYDDAVAANKRGDKSTADSLYQGANTRRYFAQGFAAAAVGCAGAAVYLYLRDRGDRKPETTAVAPVASPRFAGLAVTGSW